MAGRGGHNYSAALLDTTPPNGCRSNWERSAPALQGKRCPSGIHDRGIQTTADAKLRRHPLGSTEARSEPNRFGRGSMLYWAVVFFVVAVIAAVLGFSGIALAAAGVAKILFVIFLVLFLISIISHLARRGHA